MTRPLRIACYGFADRNSGSVASAGFVALQALLARGHAVDFFGKSSFVRPRELETFSNFRFIDTPNPRGERIGRAINRGDLLTRFIEQQIVHRTFARGIIRAMRREHAQQPYDLQLWLGDYAWARIGEIPVVSWVQGPPESDCRSIRRRRDEIIHLAGRKKYWLFRAYGLWRATFGRPNFVASDHFIVGSTWSKERLQVYGVAADRIDALPYPVDLEHFSPGEIYNDHSAPVVLWIGRTVPRKRPDLFLDACAKLINEGSPIRVKIVGGFGFLPEYRKLLEHFRHPQRLEFVEQMPRDALVNVLRCAAVLVQPSEEEDFGSSVAEALACGTPVVVGPTNGTGDYIGEGGVRFERYNANSVANAIATALQNERKLRPRARQAAEKFFDPRHFVEGLEARLFLAAGRSANRSPAREFVASGEPALAASR